jgi:hypothetical protein
MGIPRWARPLLAAVALLALLGAVPAAADDLAGQVRVLPTPTVTPHPQLFAQAAGQPVTLIDETTGKLIGHVLTGPLGQYVFHNVPAGSYKLIVGYPGALQQQIITAPGGFVQSVPPIVLSGSK